MCCAVVGMRASLGYERCLRCMHRCDAHTLQLCGRYEPQDADGPGWVGASWTGVGRWAGLGAVALRFRLVCIATDVAAVCTFSRALPLARVATPNAPGLLVTRPRMGQGTCNLMSWDMLSSLGDAQCLAKPVSMHNGWQYAQSLETWSINGPAGGLASGTSLL